MDGPPAVIRTHPAPGFKALVNDPLLKKQRITIELGQAKNPNKNPVAERAVQELETELLRQEPLGGAVSPLTLAVATLVSVQMACPREKCGHCGTSFQTSSYPLPTTI